MTSALKYLELASGIDSSKKKILFIAYKYAFYVTLSNPTNTLPPPPKKKKKIQQKQTKPLE